MTLLVASCMWGWKFDFSFVYLPGLKDPLVQWRTPLCTDTFWTSAVWFWRWVAVTSNHLCPAARLHTYGGEESSQIPRQCSYCTVNSLLLSASTILVGANIFGSVCGGLVAYWIIPYSGKIWRIDIIKRLANSKFGDFASSNYMTWHAINSNWWRCRRILANTYQTCGIFQNWNLRVDDSEFVRPSSFVNYLEALVIPFSVLAPKPLGSAGGK